MSKFLMTHSLLSSWLYALKTDPHSDATTERDPMKEFMLVLRREPTPVSEAMHNGLDFEDLVTAVLMGRPTARHHKKNYGIGDLEETWVQTKEHPWYGAAAAASEIIRGGSLQFKARKDVTVAGMDFVLYGRLDALRAGVIYDIKFSKGYERGKYFSSTQHPTYLEIVPEAKRFIYIISNGTEVWTETYEREETSSIFPVISDFIDWLNAQGLMKLYKEKWLAL